MNQHNPKETPELTENLKRNNGDEDILIGIDEWELEQTPIWFCFIYGTRMLNHTTLGNFRALRPEFQDVWSHIKSGEVYTFPTGPSVSINHATLILFRDNIPQHEW